MAVTARLGMVLCARATSLSPHTVLRTRGAAHLGAPVRRRCGGGAAHGHPQGRSPSGQAREQTSQPTRGGRATRLWAQARSATHTGAPGRARWPGSAQRAPVRRPARRLPSLHAGARGHDRTRPSVATGQRPPEPAEAPRRSRPGPSRVVSLSGPETWGPQDGCGGRGPPLQNRPTCERRGRSACRRGQTAARPMPWRR